VKGVVVVLGAILNAGDVQETAKITLDSVLNLID